MAFNDLSRDGTVADWLEQRVQCVTTKLAESNTRLTVRNTFLDVVEKPQVLRRSYSDSDCGSGTTSSNAQSLRSLDGSAYRAQSGESLSHTGSSWCALSSNGQSKASLEMRPESNSDATDATGATADTDNIPSAGSILHAEGKCQPCCFFKKNRCSSEKACSYCHYSHEKMTRPGKKARDRKAKYETGIQAKALEAPPENLLASPAGSDAGSHRFLWSDASEDVIQRMSL